MATRNDGNDATTEKECETLFQDALDNATLFIMSGYKEISPHSKIDRKKFIETAASAFSTAATSIRNGENVHPDSRDAAGDGETKFRGRASVFLRTDSMTAVREVIDKNIATWVTDTLLTEARKDLDDEEARFDTASILQGISSRMNDIRKAIEGNLEQELEETFDDPARFLFDPNNSFYNLSRQTVISEPLIKRSSSKQQEVLRRISKLKWQCPSDLWTDGQVLLEDFPDEEEGKNNENPDDGPIIVKRGSDWMLNENAVR